MKIIKFISKIEALVLLILAIHLPLAEASKDTNERSLEQCLEIVKATGSRGTDYISRSVLFPLNQLLGTRYCMQIAKNHVQADAFNKSLPGEGLAQLFATTKAAADELVERWKVKAVIPQYRKADILAGAAETLKMMLEGKEEFIREAVLYRDGIYTVVPILWRTRERNGSKPPMYVPVVVKGHQELDRFDILTTVFAAWAIGKYLGEIPDKGFVHLKPMVPVRSQRDFTLEENEAYRVNIASDLHSIEFLVKRYLKTISDEEALAEIKPKRCTQCNVCPWATFCRDKMHKSNDLTMMPFPPKSTVQERLDPRDIEDMPSMANLDINSPEFIALSVKIGIPPDRLKYWVQHANAVVKNEPLLVQNYKNPFEDVSYLFHLDMEDYVKVYLHGLKIEKIKGAGKDKVVWKKPVWAKSLEKEDVEAAWAETIRTLKTHPLLKSGDYKVTVYSQHEIVKIHQQFDMTTDEPEWFTPKQKASPFYSVVEKRGKIIDPDSNPDAGKAPKKMGRLIRNEAFFKKYPDIKPQDVFNLIDRSVDLLDYMRWTFAYPTYTNSIKKILPYVAEQLGKDVQEYLPDQNGLNSIAWILEYLQTGEVRLKNRITDYNDIDTDANVVISQLIRKRANARVSNAMSWRKGFDEIKEDVQKAAEARGLIYRLEEREKILTTLLGRPIENLPLDQRLDLMGILDRRDYYAKREKIDANKKLLDKEKEEKLQRLEHETENNRKTLLVKFLQKLYKTKPNQDLPEAVADQVAELFLMYPSNYLLPNQIEAIVMLRKMRPVAEKTNLLMAKDVRKRLEVSPLWEDLLKDIRKGGIRKDIYYADGGDERAIWLGLYYKKAFDEYKP